MTLSPGAMPSEALLSKRYRIQRKLGSGSLGTVYLARDVIADRLVALKLIRTERLGAEGVARLREEFRAIAGLHHPQIAVAHDFGYSAEGGLPFYTREYVEGSPLAPGPHLKREIERVYLTRLFKDKRGDLKKMMEALGMMQATLYRRLRAAGVDVQALRREL